ncbi:MAG: cyclic nucleotide-binding domain-containing protein [Deltaproteobacteria bacterium]|nr:cyclic nucleotide-binding domain-containing protein [Deltaproteobacteria bacterium]MBW2019216.1 cyclic nucleotide-binding domain-containing protein [Deltaproteobacteria bacterium]MBW2074022.1 cyclic nucleotide-binding domain-containing protein [Deltaproteobacteria bacterium]RLB80371.1 MAG: cyclic nucleotide-binding domain-containing protein [Deltaproteobacteria bacterium]
MIESDYLKESEDLLQKLREIRTLKPFDESDLKAILSLSKIRKYEPGELIIEEGEFDRWIYFLISGKVRIVKLGKELNVLTRRGDIFGEMGTIDGSARSASVYAIDETLCLATDASFVGRLSGNDKIVFRCILYQVFAEILASRLRLTNRELVKAKKEIARLKAELSQ